MLIKKNKNKLSKKINNNKIFKKGFFDLREDLLSNTLIHHQSPSASIYTTSMQNNSIILHTNESQHIKTSIASNFGKHKLKTETGRTKTEGIKKIKT